MPDSATQIFVTSDWHLGGSLDVETEESSRLGSSVFRSSAQLTSFLDFVGESADGFNGATHLVLNGDIVDFLAPNPANCYFPIAWQNDAKIICNELEDIAARFVGENGRGPFTALRDLADSDVQIIVLLGNHDIELCLPGVRERFIALIGGHAAVRFIYDGEAYTCGKLIVEHGNQYDRFNAFDFDLLRRERSQLSRGGNVEDDERGKTFFRPPVGSSVVVDQVNPRLPEVPFLNLLKPEIGAAVPLMLALYPETRRFFELAFAAGKILIRGVGNTKSKRKGLLSGRQSVHYSDLNSFLHEELGGDAETFLGPLTRPGQLSGANGNSDSLMKRLAMQAGKAFDKTSLRFEQWKEKQSLKCIRIALKRVRDGIDFNTDTEKDEYREPAQAMIEQGGFEAVVFGHTHFPKEVELDGGKYLNAGTWADVLLLPEGISSDNELEADAATSTFLEDMRQQKYAQYTVRKQAYVQAVVEESGSVDASLKFYGKE